MVHMLDKVPMVILVRCGDGRWRQRDECREWGSKGGEKGEKTEQDRVTVSLYKWQWDEQALFYQDSPGCLGRSSLSFAPVVKVVHGWSKAGRHPQTLFPPNLVERLQVGMIVYLLREAEKMSTFRSGCCSNLARQWPVTNSVTNQKFNPGWWVTTP